MNDLQLQEIVKQVLKEIGSNEQHANPIEDADINIGTTRTIPDVSVFGGEEALQVPDSVNYEQLKQMQKATPARIGVGRAGSRYKTNTLLKFKSDHAVSMDAVFNEVSQEFLDKNNLKTVQTLCGDKDEYLTRPDLGRVFGKEAIAEIKQIVPTSPEVLIYVADGLSSTAVEENIENILPAILSGLKNKNVQVGAPFFVKYGRVPAMDPIGDITGAQVVCTLIGERPGLVTASSMSAYMAYKPTVGMPESRRTVISNIHKEGLPPAEAGAHISEILKKILDSKSSGLELKL